MPKLRLLLVDDHEIVRIGVRTLLSRQPDFDVVDEASSGPEAVRKALAHHPDVVVMDVRLAGMSGIEACKEIKQSAPEIKVIMLTSYSDVYCLHLLCVCRDGQTCCNTTLDVAHKLFTQSCDSCRLRFGIGFQIHVECRSDAIYRESGRIRACDGFVANISSQAGPFRLVGWRWGRARKIHPLLRVHFELQSESSQGDRATHLHPLFGVRGIENALVEFLVQPVGFDEAVVA